MENTLYDLEALKKVTGGDQVFMQKMIGLFLEHTPEDVQVMEEALKTGNYKKVSSIAHKVKPSINYVCIKRIHEEVLLIEAWEGSDEDMSVKTEEFITDLRLVIDQLKQL